MKSYNQALVPGQVELEISLVRGQNPLVQYFDMCYHNTEKASFILNLFSNPKLFFQARLSWTV